LASRWADDARRRVHPKHSLAGIARRFVSRASSCPVVVRRIVFPAGRRRSVPKIDRARLRPTGRDVSLKRGPGALPSADRGIHRSASLPHPTGRQLDRSPAGRSDRVLARREPRPACSARTQASSLRRCRATVAGREGKAARPKASGRDGVAREPRRPSFGGTASRSLPSTTEVVPAAVRAVQPPERTRSSRC